MALPAPALPPATHLLYLHGFRSSPASAKSRRMAAWVAAERPDLVWSCPQLPPSPAAAVALLRAIVAPWPAATRAVVGSSLGGFYAWHLAAALDCRAVLINPAVHPARDLAAHIGRQTQYHDPAESFHFRPEFIDELLALVPGPLAHPERLLAIIAKGDEVLDWREMAAALPASPHKLVEGSDHGLSDFDSHLPDLLAHLGLAPDPSHPTA